MAASRTPRSFAEGRPVAGSPGGGNGGRTDGAPTATLEGLAPLISEDRLTRLIHDGLDLRPLRPTLNNVLAATSNVHCCADDVARAVAQDQVLSIRLLRLANSSAYSRGRSVDCLKEAIQRIGIHEVRSLVTTLALAEQCQGGPGSGLDPRLFWEHSVACGLAASALAKLRRCPDVDQFFLWGLLHDVGRVILLERVPEEYAEVCERAQELELPLEVVEPRLLHLDHCDVLDHVLRHWQFPTEFITPVASHHRSVAGMRRLRPADADRAATIALADRIVHALLLGSSGNDALYPLEPLLDHLGLSGNAVGAIPDDITEETKNLKYAMLARAHEDEWPNVAADLRASLGVPLHPMVVGPGTVVNPCQMLASRLAAGQTDTAPNLGIIWMADAKAADSLVARYELVENEAGCGPLPVLAVCGTGRLHETWSGLQHRPHVVLHCPVRIRTLVGSVRHLLSL